MQGTLASRPAGMESLLERLVGNEFYEGFLRFFKEQLNVLIGYRVDYWWRKIWFLRAGVGPARLAAQEPRGVRLHVQGDEQVGPGLRELRHALRRRRGSPSTTGDEEEF